MTKRPNRMQLTQLLLIVNALSIGHQRTFRFLCWASSQVSSVLSGVSCDVLHLPYVLISARCSSLGRNKAAVAEEPSRGRCVPATRVLLA